jgi:hypothetical protein
MDEETVKHINEKEAKDEVHSMICSPFISYTALSVIIISFYLSQLLDEKVMIWTLDSTTILEKFFIYL